MAGKWGFEFYGKDRAMKNSQHSNRDTNARSAYYPKGWGSVHLEQPALIRGGDGFRAVNYL